MNSSQFTAPPASSFTVKVGGQTVSAQVIGFKRRPLSAPLVDNDLRIANSLYLQLSTAVADNQTVQVSNPDGSLWSSSMQFVATTDPLRYSPAIHVNQEGYLPGYAKKGMVGYYLGSGGELPLGASTFQIVDAITGVSAYQGSLVRRPDSGWVYSPAPYQQVYEADFTGFNTPGQYRLLVPGMGASTPFTITDGIAMDFARAYALGLYGQRCGADEDMPVHAFRA